MDINNYTVNNHQWLNALEILTHHKRIRVPYYQREYTWNAFDVESMIDDINSTRLEESPYFLGIMILQNNGIITDVIDGQQRLSTLLLILYTLQEQSDIEFTIITEILCYSKKYIFSRDFDVLYAIIHNGVLNRSMMEHNYYKNYDIIKYKFNMPGFDCNKFLEKLSHTILSIIVLPPDVNSYKLFEKINGTGKSLDSFDLVRNYMFSNIMSNETIERTDKIMTSLLKYIDDKEKNHLIRHFIGYNTEYLYNEDKRILFREFINMSENVSYFDSDFEKLCNDFEMFMTYYVTIYKRIESNGYNKIFDDSISLINEEYKNFAILVIDLFMCNSNYSKGIILIDSNGEKLILESLKYIEDYIYRRVLVGFSNKSLTRLIPTLPRRIKEFENLNYLESLNQIMCIEANKNNTTYRMPLFKEVRNAAISKNMYKHRTKTSLLLRRIENNITDENVQLDDLTIEHILPQKPQIDGKYDWVDPESIEFKNNVNTIGNLSLLTPKSNNRAGNLMFNDKKKKSYSSSRLILNKELQELDDWNYDSISKRTNDLLDRYTDIFEIDESKNSMNDNMSASYSKNTNNKYEIIYKQAAYYKGLSLTTNSLRSFLMAYLVDGVAGTNLEESILSINAKGHITKSLTDTLELKSYKGNMSITDFDIYFNENKSKIIDLIQYINNLYYH